MSTKNTAITDKTTGNAQPQYVLNIIVITQSRWITRQLMRVTQKSASAALKTVIIWAP